MAKNLKEYSPPPKKGKPAIGNYKSRTTKGTGSGNSFLDDYAGKTSQSARPLNRTNQNVGSPAKKPNPPAQPNPGRHPFGANFVPKPPTTNGITKRAGYKSPTTGKKPANRQTY